MDLMEKLRILTDSAKYDAACTSSGVDRTPSAGRIGGCCAPGVCHAFAADGRCISLLKVLMTNYCRFDCQYCVNRRSNDVPRAAFTPKELADLTVSFYRRNMIEGLFLSSGVWGSPDETMEKMTQALRLLREQYGFSGYIHAKAIPGSSQEAVERLGLWCDRLSINIEMPSEQSLQTFAPDKTKAGILTPMATIRDRVKEGHELVRYRHAPRFAPAGQSTQMIIGASPETDRQILRLTQSLYRQYALKRVFFSAYIPVGTHALLPKNTPPPLLREHRLYQCDWLLRYYGFQAEEILDDDQPFLDPLLDPKCQWALRRMSEFPVEINRADRDTLLRVPGIGVVSANRILAARRTKALDFDDLKTIGVVLKRAIYFITCKGKLFGGVKLDPRFAYINLTADARRDKSLPQGESTQQLTWDDVNGLLPGGATPLLKGAGYGNGLSV
ncbi:MAG: putative DNA modification/repair radical SAM protein [Clostridia bacterium]|nr:putative DNA modification/repair radical SAM protein [Clostridia bacterium]